MTADQINGWEGRIEYIKETAYGTLPYTGTMGWIGDVREFSVEVKADTKERFRVGPRGGTSNRGPSGLAPQKETYSAKIVWAPQASSAVYFYMSFVGLIIGAETGPGDTRQSMVINAVHKEGTCEGPLYGGVGSYFQAKASVGEDILFEAEIKSAYYDPSAPLSVTSDLSGATDSFQQATTASGAVLNWTDSEVLLSGTTQDMITDWEFKIDNQAEERHRINTRRGPDEVIQKTWKGTGKLTYDLDSNTELLRLLAHASFTLAIKIGDKTWSMTCEWDKSSIKTKPEDPTQQELPFKFYTCAVA